MRIMLLGAAGFIGTNLVASLARDNENHITVVDRSRAHFASIEKERFTNVHFVETDLVPTTNFEELIAAQDVLYHLISTTVPTTSNQAIAQELTANVVMTANLLEACVHRDVKKIVFLSSGGTVYGKECRCPIDEMAPTNPITSYGIQKITIEKLLYLYYYLHGLDYRIIRLSNPYGPYQRPNGILGVVTTFTYKALKGEEIIVYGDGSIVRDFIFIDDAIRGILNIVNGESCYRVFNLGCGYGTSIKQLLDTIERILKVDLKVNYTEARKVDVPENYLDIKRYEAAFGSLDPISLEEGIGKTAIFMREHYLFNGEDITGK